MTYQTQVLNLKKALDQILDFGKLKYCFECGICTASCPVAELLPEHYNPRTLLHRLPSGDVEILNSAELWLCAWCNRCYNRCPQKIHLPEIFQNLRKFAVEHGYTEGFKKALKIIRENIPLPASCCYVCFHPDRAIDNKKLVTEIIKKDILDYDAKKTKPKTDVHREKVAIIGSGPAGLSAAQDLAKKGYSVTVFEGSSSCGGMLRRCIPEYRLPKNVVDLDIKRINNLGVKIKKNQTIGKNLKLENLFQGYDAVFVATGAHKEKILGIKGEELRGVFYALDFLEKANIKELEVSGKVSVIGGGDVAVDCARTALNLGAKEATILYRRSKEEMPSNHWEIQEAEEQGVKIDFLVSPKRITGEKGKVTAIECVKNELSEVDDSGRRRPIPIQGSEFEIETDYVVLAVGQFPNTDFLQETVDINKNNTIAVNPFTMETSSPRIFAGGDVTNGPATLMEAIVAGKQAAITIDCYLQSLSRDLPAINKKEQRIESDDK